ncbi:MAG: prepilin-type N-terminal cleavage/methylation domain-containing protein [Candidatus Omnitrophica bacterium]|nr:prepilin-type N-terminal cleavage/methylation domain-containing protein [Candidatus Omnitrophota bacterium]
MNIKCKILTSRSGLSLIELLVAMLIAAILLLTVGVLSRISIVTQRRSFNEMQIQADISYGFKFMRNRIREYGFGTDTPGSPWLSDRILVNGGAFGIYQKTNTKDFVYALDAGNPDPDVMKVILSVPNAGELNLDLPLSDLAPPRTITVQIDGEKNNIPFDMVMTVTKRGS